MRNDLASHTREVAGQPPEHARGRITWPTRTQQIGLVIVLAILAIVALVRAAGA
jgi:hypothetical protein